MLFQAKNKNAKKKRPETKKFKLCFLFLLLFLLLCHPLAFLMVCLEHMSVHTVNDSACDDGTDSEPNLGREIARKLWLSTSFSRSALPPFLLATSGVRPASPLSEV